MSSISLGDICKVTAGQSAPQDPSVFGKEGKPFIRAGSLEKLINGGAEEDCELIPADNAVRLRLRLFPQNTILFAKSGMSAKIGRVHRLRTPSYVVSHLAAVIPGKKVDPSYLQRWFEKNPPSRLIPNEAYPSIRTSEISLLKISLPPLPEQKRIAAILDKADAIRCKRQQATKLADEFLRATFLEMFGDPVTNPKGWGVKIFGEIGTLDRGVSKHRPRNAPELLGGPYPLIQTGEVANSGGYIRNYKNTYSKIGLKQSKIWPKGTLCITIAANIAKTGILTFDACFPDSVVGFTPNLLSTTEYVQFWLSFLQKILEEKAPESAQKNINLNILRNLDAPLPPIDLQKKFSFQVGKVETLKEKQRVNNHCSSNLFNSLTQRAFRGEL